MMSKHDDGERQKHPPVDSFETQNSAGSVQYAVSAVRACCYVGDSVGRTKREIVLFCWFSKM